MNKIILFTVLLFTTYSSNNLNCIENKSETTGISIDDTEYSIHIDIETLATNQISLVVKMDLKNDAHFVSPHDKGNLKGQFFMDLGTYNDINFDGTIIETPRSKEDYGPNSFDFTKANWMTTDTTYKQPMYVISKGDFQVFGRIKFVIEPRSTLEEIPFSIISENGVLKVIQPKC